MFLIAYHLLLGSRWDWTLESFIKLLNASEHASVTSFSKSSSSLKTPWIKGKPCTLQKKYTLQWNNGKFKLAKMLLKLDKFFLLFYTQPEQFKASAWFVVCAEGCERCFPNITFVKFTIKLKQFSGFWLILIEVAMINNRMRQCDAIVITYKHTCRFSTQKLIPISNKNDNG